MQEVSIVGPDLAKRVFQVHAAGSDGSVVLRRKLSRGQVVSFFMDCPDVQSRWRPAPQRTTGRARSVNSATVFA